MTWGAGRHIADSFLGWTSLIHLWSLGTTGLLVQTDVDADVNRWAADQNETVSSALGLPGLAGGALAPVLLPAGMYLFSDDPDINQGAAAAGQSVILAFLANTLLKAVTGRRPPDSSAADDITIEERSRGFRLGFLRGGVFDGWPSGHSMVNMALAASLAGYFDDHPWIQAAAFGWAVYVMASVTIGAQGDVHWLSDAVAGGAMGFCIGWTIGRDFAGNRSELPDSHRPGGLVLIPAPVQDGLVIQALFSW